MTVAAIVFVIVALLRTGGVSSELWRLPRTWMVLGGVGLLYGATLGLVLACWVLLLKSVSKTDLSASHLLRIYALFQLLKYAPTNVFHYVGRYAMLRRLGVDSSAVAWSTLAETALISLAATLIAASFGLSFLRAGLPDPPSWLIWILVGAMLALGAGAAVAFRKSAAVRREFTLVSSPESLRAMALTAPIYGLFFVATGFAFWLMAQLLPGDLARPDLGPSIGALTAAWLSGFITPGAPAGIGIRETMIVLALGATGSSIADGVLLSAFYRIVTISGDMVFAGASYLASLLVPSRKAH